MLVGSTLLGTPWLLTRVVMLLAGCTALPALGPAPPDSSRKSPKRHKSCWSIPPVAWLPMAAHGHPPPTHPPTHPYCCCIQGVGA